MLRLYNSKPFYAKKRREFTKFWEPRPNDIYSLELNTAFVGYAEGEILRP